MLVFSSRHPRWLSNSFLAADRSGGTALLIDTGAPPEPLLAAIEEHELELSYILLTHHHPDHIAHNALFTERFGAPLCGHPAERELFGHLDIELDHEAELRVGELHVRALHVPGHTLGQLSFVVDEERVFTGDTLFRGSIGGTRGKGHTSFADLKHSILERLLQLPDELIVHPGHMDDTTIGQERTQNPFVRYWRGEAQALGERVQVQGRPATLLVDAEDYDGGRKCQVRFEDDASEDIVGGSKVQRV
jgi:hydroxyacylglutathione hydrolase